jgi:hypothetical protein
MAVMPLVWSCCSSAWAMLSKRRPRNWFKVVFIIMVFVL